MSSFIQLALSSAATASLAAFSRFFKLHFERFVAHDLAVESSNGGASFMAFHFNKAEAFAFAAENIRCQFDGAHLAELGKHLDDAFFGGLHWQTTNKHLFHVSTSVLESVVSTRANEATGKGLLIENDA